MVGWKVRCRCTASRDPGTAETLAVTQERWMSMRDGSEALVFTRRLQKAGDELMWLNVGAVIGSSRDEREHAMDREHKWAMLVVATTWKSRLWVT